VDLEALGIKRLTVPKSIIDKMPVFIYTCNEDGPVPEPQQGTGNQQGAEEIKKSTSTTPPGPASDPSPHAYQRHAQPTCPICLEDFISGSTMIRELPCGHIFHPECVDSFLRNNSSLCPMCKKSTLPLGHCPQKITNTMVRRERAIRRLRSRVTVNEEGHDIGGSGRNRLNDWRSQVRRIFVGSEASGSTSGTQNYDPNLALRALQGTPARRATQPAAGSFAFTRHGIAQWRASELLEGTPVMEEVDTDDRTEHRPTLCGFFHLFSKKVRSRIRTGS
jgi:hypothetical protein